MTNVSASFIKNALKSLFFKQLTVDSIAAPVKLILKLFTIHLNHCANHSLGVIIVTGIITLRLVIVLRTSLKSQTFLKTALDITP